MTRIALLITLLLTTPGTTVPQDITGRAVGTPMVAISPEAQELIDWTASRFAAAGLELPEVEFIIHDSLFACDGHIGLYYARSRTLHLCRLDRASTLHELAHAWADLNLTNNDRNAFTAHVGMTNWNSHDEPWELRATEHAAETIAWALAEEETTVRWILDSGETINTLLTLPGSTVQQLRSNYRVLTGSDSPFRGEISQPSEATTGGGW